MTAPNTTNNVTVRKLADVAEGMWNKSKNAFVNASGDTMTGRLTMENSPLNQVITGTGTTAKTAGSPTKYYPAKWTFDLGIATPNAGDRIVIKLPCAGHDYGIWMSTDNGTTYFPVATQTTTSRLGTRYPSGAYICVVFETYVSGSTNSGAVNDVYPVDGGTSRISPRIGCWRVLNDYNSGNTYERTYLYSVKYYAGPTGIKNKTLICLDKAGTFSMLTSAGSGQGSDKTINTDGKFKLDAIILFYTGNDTAANALAASNSAGYVVYPSCDARYSYNPSGAMVANKPLYIECTVDDDGFWSPTTKCITQTLETGKYYIFLGLICNDSSYTFALAPQHPLYYYDGTNLTERPNKVESSQTNGNIKINGTETNVYTHPTDAGNKHIPAGGSSGQFLGWDSAGTAKWVSNPNTDIKVKATAKTDDANYKILATASASPTTGAATEAVYDTDITLNPSTNTISANVSGTAASAGKLTTARTTYVTLGTASTSTTRDWSGTTTIPVSGTLGLGNGGTGATSAAGARTNLDVYSKSETESLLNGKVVVVTQLPATGESGVTYYVKDTSSSAVDKYDEYIWAKDAGASTESWIHVGEKSIDLSNYVNALSTSGSGPLVASLSKSGNTLTATMGTISIDDLSDWATDTDVTVSSVTYHTWWPVAPTSSNQVYGLSIYNGRLYRIYNNKGTYSAQAYDTNTTYTNKSLGQGYGTCATDAATAAKIVSMSDYVLATGGIVTVKFTNALCASATMNINGKGAKPIYIKGAAVTDNNAATVSAGDTAYFMYDGTAYHLLGTDRAATNPIVNISRSGTTFTATRLDGSTFNFTQQDNNTTYTQAKLGQGYGTCTTAEATAAKSVTLTGYELEPNGVVAVKFTNGLCASATMSINGKTATPIYINGAAVTTTSCKEVLAGDLAFFIYDGSHYQFICTDRISKNGITGLSISGKTITYTRADGSTGTLTTQDTTYTFDGVYNSSSNKAATVSTVTNAVNALDVDDITGFGAGKTLATLTETDGKIAATFQNISITKSQVSDFSHSHGNITNDGQIQSASDTAIAADDKIIVADKSNGNKLVRSSVTFDGSTTTTALTPKGTWEAFAKASDISTAINALDVSSVGGAGTYISAISETDGKISATATTMDTTPTASSTNAVTSGGVKTALDGKAASSHTHGNIANGGTLTDTAAAAAGNDYVVIRDADNAKIQTSTIKGTDVADAVSKKHSHSTLTLSTTAQTYDGSHTLALPSTDPYTSARTPASHSHGSITNDGKIGSTANLSVVTGTSGAVTTTDLTTADPSASGNSLAFIDSVSQDSKGKITATKKNVTIDSALSSTSTNPVQNKVVQEAMATHTHSLLSAEPLENAQLPNNSERDYFKRFNGYVPAYLAAVKLYDVTEFYDGTIINISSEQSTFVGDVSFIRSSGVPLVSKSKVCMTQSYNRSGVILYGDTKRCHPIVLKDSRNVLSSWISGSYIPTGDIGSTVNMTPTANSNMAHCVIDCASYSTLYVNLLSVTGAPAWAFIDSTNKVIAKTSSITANATVDVPQGAAKIICAIQNASDIKQYSYVAAESTTPRYYLALQTNIGSGSYMVCEGRFFTRTTATNTISARPLITEDFAISNTGAKSTVLPAGYSVHVDTSYTDIAGTLGTARKLAVSLSNTSTDTLFDGSADVTNIKTTGTLGIANGGTGATTKKAAEFAICGNMAQATAAMADNFQFVFSRVGTDQNATNGVFIYRTASTIWDYMKGKIKADSHCLDSDDAIDIWNSI